MSKIVMDSVYPLLISNIGCSTELAFSVVSVCCNICRNNNALFDNQPFSCTPLKENNTCPGIKKQRIKSLE